MYWERERERGKTMKTYRSRAPGVFGSTDPSAARFWPFGDAPKILLCAGDSGIFKIFSHCGVRSIVNNRCEGKTE